MQPKEFKELEIYSGLRIPQSPYITRLDGWHFHTFTKQMRYEKPYDISMSISMVEAATKLFRTFKPKFAYTFSDEISFFFPKAEVFDRLEKLDSLLAASFSMAWGRLVTPQADPVFDCRIIPVKTYEEVRGYMLWRQAECKRNHDNGYAEKLLTGKLGLSPMVAAKKMLRLKGKEKYDMCIANGLDLATTPSWQRNGIIVISESYMKKGFNPITKENVMAKRERVVVKDVIPPFRTKDGEGFLQTIIPASAFGQSARIGINEEQSQQTS